MAFSRTSKSIPIFKQYTWKMDEYTTCAWLINKDMHTEKHAHMTYWNRTVIRPAVSLREDKPSLLVCQQGCMHCVDMFACAFSNYMLQRPRSHEFHIPVVFLTASLNSFPTLIACLMFIIRCLNLVAESATFCDSARGG